MAGLAIVEAPSDLGLKPTGVHEAPAALLQLGLAERLGARRAGALERPAGAFARDPATGIQNEEAIARWSPRLAAAVEAALAHGDLPLVLGGDCSILLGTLLALRRRGRYGLLYVDGHADFYQPAANPTGEVASMDLAFATGHGPGSLADLEGRGPLVRDEDVVVFGFRDQEEQAAYGSQPLPPAVRAYELEAVRRLGVEAAAGAAVAHLARAELDGFLVHLDADCLDDGAMPAVDYRLPGGLTVEELAAVLRAARASGRAAALEVTIYNPALDTDGAAGQRLVDALVAGWGP